MPEIVVDSVTHHFTGELVRRNRRTVAGMNRRLRSGLALVPALLLTLLIGFARQRRKRPDRHASGSLTGAGSTFINPLMSQWSKQYNTMYPNVTINYQSIGSGGGIQQFLAKTVNFGASDAPLTDDQFQQAGGPTVALHIPMTLGSEAVTYNLPGVTSMMLTGDVLAKIYLGTITNWNDPAHRGAQSRRQPAGYRHRRGAPIGRQRHDRHFHRLLEQSQSRLESQVGRGTSVNWPTGIGGQGNEGVTNQVKLTEGGIGYVELAYAIANSLPYAQMQNADGNFVAPTVETTTAAAAHHRRFTSGRSALFHDQRARPAGVPDRWHDLAAGLRESGGPERGQDACGIRLVGDPRRPVVLERSELRHTPA